MGSRYTDIAEKETFGRETLHQDNTNRKSEDKVES